MRARLFCFAGLASLTTLLLAAGPSACSATASSDPPETVDLNAGGAAGAGGAGAGPVTDAGPADAPELLDVQVDTAPPPDLCEAGPGLCLPDGGLIVICGDGRLGPGETCDDGNISQGDGCTGNCQQIEADWVCPVPGEPCIYTVECGDRVLGGAESCDDGNALGGDGCSDSCALETGWTCPLPGKPCQAAECGDDILAGLEECEDGNVESGDGCDASCMREAGYACINDPSVDPPSLCHPTVCNDGVHEGDEPCDDGNDVVGDGCNPYCEVEPNCPPQGGACASRCGDGLILTSDAEECDDGNTIDGDGCSSTCQAEPGYECTLVAGQLPSSLTIPFVFRDFVAYPTQTGTMQRHPDFQGGCLGPIIENMVQGTLDVDGKPVNSGLCALPATCTPDVGYTADQDNCLDRDGCPADPPQDACARSTHPNHPLANHPGVDPFTFWYRDTPDVNRTLVTPITLASTGVNTYHYNPIELFPIDNFGWVTEGEELRWNSHNYGFTSEVRYWFQFQGGESLTFTGDDDLFVFVNGQLALELGSRHASYTMTVVLNADGTATCEDCVTVSRNIGVVPGNVYEIALFHAERQTAASNFELTLGGFASSESTCAPVCGDGVVTPDEECDNGAENVAPPGDAYGACTTLCELGAYCGDRIVNGTEDCDDGVNLTLWGPTGCAPGCVPPAYCGDGLVQGEFEECDDPATVGQYGGCTELCLLGPRCGDGIWQPDHEECDDGNQNDSDGCTSYCHINVPQ